MPSVTSVSIPQPGVAFLSPDGTVSRQWYYFLIGMFSRTGGNTPVNPADSQAQIVSLFVEQAFDGETPTAQQAISAFAAMAEPVDGPAQVNPFLAALLISDAP